MKIKHENILNATEDAIIQQCNCISRKPHGLSQQINNRFDYCKMYINRPGKSPNTATVPAIPGTIEIWKGNGPDIICLLAQYGMGKPGSFGNTIPDTPELRLKWFAEALNRIDEKEYKSLAVPWKIGCGLAGGSWDLYQPLIEELDRRIPVTIYQI